MVVKPDDKVFPGYFEPETQILDAGTPTPESSGQNWKRKAGKAGLMVIGGVYCALSGVRHRLTGLSRDSNHRRRNGQ
jgi:hypothetical protein